jgi:hypothetical protein
VPFDRDGVLLSIITDLWQRATLRGPDDLVFANRAGKPLDRRNLLNRHMKPVATKLGLPAGVDFRSFRGMHASLMRRSGARPEVTRDNMGHTETDLTMDVYTKVWWDERVDAVSRAVKLFMESAPAQETPNSPVVEPAHASKTAMGAPEWVPQGVQKNVSE